MTETEEHRAIIAWFRDIYPEYARSLRVSQSAGRKGGNRNAAIRWAKIKAMGGMGGESDIAILIPKGTFGALILEHKAEGGTHQPSQAQLEYIEYHNTIGNCGCVTRGIEAAKAAISQYMEMV